MSNKYRVRCSPSPSGLTLHLGNCKTFVFNYLFAQKYGADFCLRIDDTDKSREVANGADNILRDLVWLGLVPNMGYGTDNKPAKFYRQSERLDTYRQCANELLQKGLAYKCYCSQAELDKLREEALAKDPKNPFKYPGTCANLKQELNQDYVIRLKTPKDGFTEVNDIAFGKRQIPNKENYDFAIMRSNGMPLFGFANVIDDGIIDHITHVIRGADHYPNMVQHLLIYKALGVTPPVFCHLPILRSKTNAKLSKRDGTVSVADYRNQGYAPSAIINYLVKFGWGYGNQELFSLEELIEKFELEACNSRDGKFDPVKFASINYDHLKSETLTPTDRYIQLLVPFTQARGINLSAEQLIPYVPVIRSRAKTFVEAADLLVPILTQIQPDADLIGRTYNQQTCEYLEAINGVLCNVDAWNEGNLRTNIQNWLMQRNLSLKDIGAPLRVALLGQSNSPELFQVITVMGKATTLGRLNNAIAQCRELQ